MDRFHILISAITAWPAQAIIEFPNCNEIAVPLDAELPPACSILRLSTTDLPTMAHVAGMWCMAEECFEAA
jgi:hypothetical protein